MDQISPEPWVTPLLTKAAHLFQKSYGRLPDFGMGFCLNMNNIPFLHYPKNTFACKVVQILILTISLLLSFIAIKETIFSSKQSSGFELVQKGILITCACWGGASSFIRQNYLQSEGLMSTGINTFMGSATYKSKQLNKWISSSKDTAGLLLLYLMFGVIIFGIPLPLVFWYYNLDPFSYVFLKLGFDSKVMHCIFAPILIVFSVIYIGLHNLIVVIFTLGLAFLSICSHLETLKNCWNNRRNQEQLLKYYVEIRLLFNLFEYPFSNIIMAMVLLSQVAITSFLWLTVNCYDVIPMFLALCCGAAFVGAVGIAIFLLCIASSARLLSLDVIKLGCGTEQFRNHAKGGSTIWICRRQWWSQRGLPIKCGDHFFFSKSAVINYFVVLNSHLTNAHLLIKV